MTYDVMKDVKFLREMSSVDPDVRYTVLQTVARLGYTDLGHMAVEDPEAVAQLAEGIMDMVEQLGEP